MIAIVCPGQGAQSAGMLSPWVQTQRGKDLIESYSQAAGIDLLKHGTVSDDETIRQTAITQPLLTANALLAFDQITTQIQVPTEQLIVAGHSVGEFPAATIAGVFDDNTALRLVAKRAALMQQSAIDNPSSMTAVVGGDKDAVLQAISDAGLWAANINAEGQIVAAGTAENLAKLPDLLPPRTRAIALTVAGAFHTPLMASAHLAFSEYAKDVAFKEPEATLLSNFDGKPYPQGEIISRLANQIANPVRWDLIQNELQSRNVKLIVELAPGGVLSGIAKRSLKGIPSVAIKTPEDISTAVAEITAHIAS